MRFIANGVHTYLEILLPLIAAVIGLISAVVFLYFQRQKERLESKKYRMFLSPKWIEQLDEISKDLHQLLYVQTYGLGYGSISAFRSIPIRIYVAGDAGDYSELQLNVAVSSLAEGFGFSLSDEYPAEYGSFLKQWWARTTKQITQDKLDETAAQIERAIKLKGLEQPQADVNKTHAEAVALLLKSLEHERFVAMQVGSILLLKRDGAIQVKTLSHREMAYIERHQDILKDPHSVLDRLKDAQLLTVDKS